MRRYGPIGLALIALTGTVSGGEAQECNLNRKTISFTITICSQQGCKQGAERIDILGQHVVHYNDANAHVGNGAEPTNEGVLSEVDV